MCLYQFFNFFFRARISESDRSSDESESMHSDQLKTTEISCVSMQPLLDSNASTPDPSYEIMPKKIKNKATNTNNKEDDIHECYSFSMLIAKYLSKLNEARRQECMHQIVHIVMDSIQEQRLEQYQ